MVRETHSGGTALFGRSLLRLTFCAFGLIPGEQSLQVVTIRAIAAKGILVEEPLDSASCAYLISTALGANRPTHFAVPAASEDHGGTRQAGCEQAHRPQPSTSTPRLRRLLVFFRHHYLTCKKLLRKDIPNPRLEQSLPPGAKTARSQIGNIPLFRKLPPFTIVDARFGC